MERNDCRSHATAVRCILGAVMVFTLTIAAAAQTAPAPKPANGSGKPVPAKSTHASPAPITLKEAQTKIVGAWALEEDGKVPKDENGNLIGSVLSFDANNHITFRVETSGGARYVMTNTMSYQLEKDPASGLMILSGDLNLKFAILSITGDILSARYFDDSGKPADWVARWQRISTDPILPH